MPLYDELAILYDAAASVGMTPNEVDDTEIWMVAAAIGANRPKANEHGGEAGNDLIAERVRAAREGRKLDPKAMRWGQDASTLRSA